MKTLTLLLLLVLAWPVARADFTCPQGTEEACLETGDTVCPASAKCVDDKALCLDARDCGSARGYICGSLYDEVLADYEKAVAQYNQLTAENVELRDQALERRNCVINAQTLKAAIACVRQPD
jgi:hypothetical protein